MESSQRLSLPFISPGQAQKELYVNESLQILDFVTAASVEEPRSTIRLTLRSLEPAFSLDLLPREIGPGIGTLLRPTLPRAGGSQRPSKGWRRG